MPKSAARTTHEPSAKPVATPQFFDSYLAALLARASHLISAEFHAIVRQHGVSVLEWRVLASLSSGGPISIGRLAEITVTKQPTLTRAVHRMESRGQVRRVRGRTDRRVTLISTTAKGRRTVATLIRLAREHEQRVLQPFGLARAEELKGVLRGMIDLHREGQ